MSPRTKLALVQNTIIGVPVILVISAFNGVTASDPSLVVHTLGSAVFGFATSLTMLYITLVAFRIKSRYDEKQGVGKAMPQTVPGAQSRSEAD
jgi:hypothetical protein